MYLMQCNRQRGHKDVVSLLIDRGAVVDKTDLYGYTPLYGAAEVSPFRKMYFFSFSIFSLTLVARLHFAIGIVCCDLPEWCNYDSLVAKIPWLC